MFSQASALRRIVARLFKQQMGAADSPRRSSYASQMRFYLEKLERTNRDLQAAASAQGRFVMNVSHEIRTPLSAIHGYLDQLIAERHSPDEQARVLHRTKRCANLLGQILSDLIDISKMDGGQMQVNLSNEVNLREILNEIQAVYRTAAESKGLTFAVTLSNPVPSLLMTDPVRVRQVLMALVGNALKFTNTGHVSIAVGWHELESGRGRIDFIVEDSGCGIPASSQTKIFERFSKVDDSLTRPYGGAGLGLALAVKLAKLLEGEIKLVRSAPGSGSIFRFSMNSTFQPGTALMERFEERDDASLPSLDVNQIAGSLHGARVLLVEDGADNRRIFEYFLRLAGAEVVIAEDGATAVQIATHDFDVILMDIQMPVLDGFGATALLRQRGITAPILALTAHAINEERERSVQAGFDDYIVKPVNMMELMAKLRGYMAAKKSGGEAASSMMQVTQDGAGPIRSRYHDQEVYQPLIQAFVAGLSDRRHQLQSAFKAQDWGGVAKTAHKMKGAASAYGFPALTECAGHIEDEARRLQEIGGTGPDAGTLSDLVGDFDALCQRVIEGHQPATVS